MCSVWFVVKFDCTGLDDGVYVDGCSNVYWFCAGETASLSKCPKEIAYTVLEPYEKRDACEKREDGEYAVSRCHSKYLLCLSGKALLVRCLRGQLFSQKHGYCVSVNEMPHCFIIQKVTGANLSAQ
ncbi:unnamed protein product [Gongylonema pulchrum]|uniref:Chitin-binding type-2 domain-containing protein n=1 Tax=Gongylonema pulchrum TaxID=637853 RepID=A0A183CWL7_9BILA|nr:unnamed protein product [Gongylonema pulchrum]